MRSALTFTLLVALAPAATSQSVLYTFLGDSQSDYFGWSARGAGDVNGDGIPDLIVGAPFDDNTGSGSGSVRVLSGRDGSVLHGFDGDAAGDRLGISVGGAGDVDGDGFADVIAGAPGNDSNGDEAGLVRVFSGASGAVLYTLYGDDAGDGFGGAVAGAGDVNGDGFSDLIIGASSDDDGGAESGRARVFSGLDGSVLHTFDGDSVGDALGAAVSGAGDVNGDGTPDLIVGAHDDQVHGLESGSAFVYSGLDGSLLHTFHGDEPGDLLGIDVRGAGDVNGDGFADLIVGAPGANGGGADSGMARVFSGVDGTILHTFHGDSPQDWFGSSASGAGDVDGDGLADLVVGAFLDDASGSSSGRVTVYSAGGSVLFAFDGDPGAELGIAVDGAGDVNGDGHADLIAGARADDAGAFHAGSARVVSGCDSIGSSYCTPAVPNSTGQPAAIAACGSASVDLGYLVLEATELPIGQFGYFLASESQGFIANPGGSQGNLCLSGDIGRFKQQIRNSGAGGRFTIRVDLEAVPTNPPQAVMPGETWHFQAWFRDKNPQQTSNFTDAVSVTFS